MEEGFSRPSIQLLPFAFLLLPSRGLRLGRLWERNKHSNNPQSEFLVRFLKSTSSFRIPTSMVYGRNTQKRSYFLWLCFSVVTISLTDGRRLFLPMNPTFAFCLLPSYFCLQEVCASVVFGSETNIRTIRKANSFVRFLKSTSSFCIPTSMVYGRNTQKRSYFLCLCFSVVTISLTDGRRLFSPLIPIFAFCLLTFAFREGRLPAPSLRGAPRSLYLMTSLAKVIVVQIPTCRWQPTYRLPLQRLRRAP